MPNIIYNANIYLNGSNLAAQATELELPEIEPEMAEHEALGLYGTPVYPMGLQEMEATITWSSFYPEWARAAANFTQAVNLQARASVEIYEPSGRTAELPLLITMRGVFKKNPMGTYTQKEMAEFESDLSLTYIKQVFNGETMLECDVVANIYRVGGTDLLANFRANLGL